MIIPPLSLATKQSSSMPVKVIVSDNDYSQFYLAWAERKTPIIVLTLDRPAESCHLAKRPCQQIGQLHTNLLILQGG